VEEAMERLIADGVKEVVVQPTHVMSGYEYDDIVEEVSKYADEFDSLKIGVNLLNSDEDYARLVEVLTEEFKKYEKKDTAIVFMGHGTEHESNATYAKLQEAFAGHENYFVGTVEAEPSLDDVVQMAKDAGVKKVVLAPLMIVAGDHANNDMAGDEEDSWKTVFEAEGFQVECVLQGLGQYEGVQQMIVDHVAATLAEGAQAETAETVKHEGPIYASDLVPGDYAITVDSSSSMFRVVAAELHVTADGMTVTMTMSGQGYGKLFMGTGEEAAEADEDEFIPFENDLEGNKTFTVPVEALDLETDCAAWSVNREEWYDRVLVFESAQLPAEAFAD